VDKVKGALSWRRALIAVELLIAAGCFYAGWQLVSNHRAGGAVQVHRAEVPPASEGDGFLGIPGAPSRVLPRHGVVGGPKMLSSDLLARLNRDDFDLYRSQWRIIQLLVEGVRQYLVQRVVPALLAI
jgi:hypothetical protein